MLTEAAAEKDVKCLENNNAVIYARYSSHNQTEQSIEGQLAECHAFAKKNGYSIIHEYVDRAISGTTHNRPDFLQMISDSAKKQFKFVIVYQLDRFARNRFDSATFKTKLKKNGVRVLSARENITDDASGILVEGLLESMAEYYSAELSQKVVRGLKESAKKGLFNGGGIPLGYKVAEHRLVIDEEQAEIIKHIYTSYLGGEKIKNLCQYLNERGIKNSRGNEFSPTGIRYLLSNQRYVGVDPRETDELRFPCPAIIEQKLFDDVQLKLAENKHPGGKHSAKVKYLLSGKLYCGKCSERMLGESGKSRSGDVYHYYACRGKKKFKTCDKINEKKDFIEWYVVEQTVKYVLEPKRRDFIAEKIVEKFEEDLNRSDIPALERELKKADSEMERCVNHIISNDNEIIVKKFEQRLDELALIKNDLETEIAEKKNAAGIVMTKKEIKAWLNLFCKGDPLDPDFQRKIIDVFIKRVYLYDNDVLIYYNLKNGKLVSGIEPLQGDYEVFDGSDTNQLTPPNVLLSEPRYIIKGAYFGILLKR